MKSFFETLFEHGFSPPHQFEDGRYHRWDIGKRGNKAGYYNYDPTTKMGVFGSWATSEQFFYRANQAAERMTESEREETARFIKAAQIKARKEKENENHQAAIRARQAYEAGLPCTVSGYLERKQIKPYLARQTTDGRLMVPIYKGEKFVNVQFIDARGEKRFLTGGEKKGCYCTIEGERRIIFICEGYATAATVREATGQETICAFDADNLIPVARAIRKLYGIDATICIAGDNDHGKAENKGLIRATEAAEQESATVKVPEGITGTDWNDAAVEFGMSWVRDALAPPEQEIIAPLAAQLAAPEIILDLNENGKPMPILANLERILKGHGVTLRYNVIAKREEIIIPSGAYSIDNAEAAAYSQVLSYCRESDLTPVHINEYLTLLADRLQYNPVATWIESREWDGTDRLPAFYDTVTERVQSPLKIIKMKRWMLSAVAAAYSPRGISAHGVLVLQGEQYLGKTFWLKNLVPSDLELIKEAHLLRVDDKDNLYQCLSNWIVELGELDATFKKSDISALKAFLTADRDVMRMPFAPKKSTFPRRTIFFGSVNPKEFLFDETGNRRFWVIECVSINHSHGLDMQQVWAQFLAMFRAGEPYIMSLEEIAQINKENEEHEGYDSVRERVSQFYDWGSLTTINGEWKTATDIALALGIKNPTNAESQRVAQAVKKLNGDQRKRGGAGGTRMLLVPRKEQQSDWVRDYD